MSLAAEKRQLSILNLCRRLALATVLVLSLVPAFGPGLELPSNKLL